MEKYRVEEREGYTGRIIRSNFFDSKEEALEFFDSRRVLNRFAGVGGIWKHYFTYPQRDLNAEREAVLREESIQRQLKKIRGKVK